MSGKDSAKVRLQLYEAVAAHKADLEITRGFAGLERKVLDRRIENTGLLLEWLDQALDELPPEGRSFGPGPHRYI